jgi:hypothetical protein
MKIYRPVGEAVFGELPTGTDQGHENLDNRRANSEPKARNTRGREREDSSDHEASHF